jgi:hypothetical protein
VVAGGGSMTDYAWRSVVVAAIVTAWAIIAIKYRG